MKIIDNENKIFKFTIRQSLAGQLIRGNATYFPPSIVGISPACLSQRLLKRDAEATRDSERRS